MYSEIEKYKEVMKNGMIDNFKRDGNLVPVVFFVENFDLTIAEIPNHFLLSEEGKNALSVLIRNKCANPNIQAAGMIIEAWGAKIDVDGDVAKALENSEIKVSDLDEKVDIIILIFSTPTKSEIIAYRVDSENKKILDNFGDEIKSISGRFSDFFKWTQN